MKKNLIILVVFLAFHMLADAEDQKAHAKGKRSKPGVAIPGLSMKGNTIVPFSKDSKKELHDCIMHLYDHAFYGNHAHVLEIMNAIIELQTKKDCIRFKKASGAIHKASDNWRALQDAVSSYDVFACKQVEIFKKKRLQKIESVPHYRLQRAVRKISHKQPLLMYASGRLAHSRLLLSEYAQNDSLNQDILVLENMLKSSDIQKKFNTSNQRMVMIRNRLVALCVLLEGAVLHYCAVQESLVSEIEKQSLPEQKSMHAIIQEIQETVLI